MRITNKAANERHGAVCHSVRPTNITISLFKEYIFFCRHVTSRKYTEKVKPLRQRIRILNQNFLLRWRDLCLPTLQTRTWCLCMEWERQWGKVPLLRYYNTKLFITPVGVNRPEREVDYSSPSSVEVKNGWRYTPTPCIRFIVWPGTTLSFLRNT